MNSSLDAPAPSSEKQLGLASVVPEADVLAGEGVPAAEGSAAEGLAADELAADELAVLAASGPAADEPAVPESPVNYDDEGLLEVSVEDTLYRFDAGKQGTALCLSSRSEGSWSWHFLGELRWDGRDLRSRALDRRLLGQLSTHLRELNAASGDY